MQLFAIIVAGGCGSRMKSDIPKQFLNLCGRPILMHTIDAFARFSATIEPIVVLPEAQISYWKELCLQHNFHTPHHIVKGGNTRFHSVQNGLALVPAKALVAVHDGVRPLVSAECIARCYEAAELHGTAIPVIKLTDSIRQITAHDSQSVDRTLFRAVQTPQVFRSELLKDAYEQPYSPLFTDDASVLESTKKAVFLVEGDRQNIKITTPFDLCVAECAMKQKS